MGLPPSEADKLSLWQYGALVRGWNEAHRDPTKPEALPEFSDTETLEEMGITDGQD